MQRGRAAFLFTSFATVAAYFAIAGPARRLAPPAPPAPTRRAAGPAPAATAKLANLPLAFVENRGQWATDARFVARRGGLVARIEDGAIALQRSVDALRGVLVRVAFESAGPGVEPQGEERLPGCFNFLVGSDPSSFRTEVPAYGSVVYRGVRPGVDVRIREGATSLLEYDLELAPGADLDAVALRCDGIEAMRLAPDGSLVLETAAGPLLESPPLAWCAAPDGSRGAAVACRFRLIDATRFGFAAPARDGSLALTIDPGLDWASYLGGPDADLALAVATDPSSGALVVAGRTVSTEFPTTPGAYDSSFGGGGPASGDAFVTRFDPTGRSLVYSSYLGGSGDDAASAVALAGDGSGVVTVAGRTSGAGFPATPGAYAEMFGGGASDAFVARLDAAGSTLLYSTYLGGSGRDEATAVALDGADAVVTGSTPSADFPTTPGAYDQTPNGGDDVFVTRLDASAGALVYSTLLGGSSADRAFSLALEHGEAVIAGSTASADFPATPGAYDESFNGGAVSGDAFVARLGADGRSLVYATFLGGDGEDTALALALDGSGAPTVVGSTASAGFPTTPGAYDTDEDGGIDAFVARLDPSGSVLVFSTRLGGSGDDVARGVAVQSNGTVTVGGETSSAADFPTTFGAFQATYGGGSGDGFVARLKADGSGLLHATLMGGAGADAIRALALDGIGAAIVAGSTDSVDFPVTPGAYDTAPGGGAPAEDAFVSRVFLGGRPFIALTPMSTTVHPGDFLYFDIDLENETDAPLHVMAWIDILRPSGAPFRGNPIIGPARVTLSGHQAVFRSPRLRIPGRVAPSGPYTIRASAGTFPDAPEDLSSFEFSVGE